MKHDGLNAAMELDGLSLFRLRVFVTVVDRGGYSAAALHLNLSQPSVSFHVKALERLFGARLIVYRERAICLTGAGEELYRCAQLMLHDGEKLVEAIHLIGEGQRGRLDVGVSGSMEHRGFFDRVLAPYQGRHPQSHLSLRFGHSPALANLLLERELDLAYMQKRAFEPAWWATSGLQYEPLHYGSFVFFVAPRHPLAAKRVVTPEELEEAAFIVAPKEHEESARLGALLRAAGLSRQRGLVEMEGLQSRKLAAEAGLGVLPAFLLPYAEVEAFAPLRRLQLTTPAPRVEYGLVSRRDEPWSPLMHDFAGQLRATSQAAALPDDAPCPAAVPVAAAAALAG